MGPRKHSPLFPRNNHSPRPRLPFDTRLQHSSRCDLRRKRARRSRVNSLHPGLRGPPLLLRWHRRLRTSPGHGRSAMAQDARSEHDRIIHLRTSRSSPHGLQPEPQPQHYAHCFDLCAPGELPAAASRLQCQQSGSRGSQVFAGR